MLRQPSTPSDEPPPRAPTSGAPLALETPRTSRGAAATVLLALLAATAVFSPIVAALAAQALALAVFAVPAAVGGLRRWLREADRSPAVPAIRPAE